MKKTLVALAALAVVSAASAQSTVTMYGVVDMGIAQLKDSNNTNSNTAAGILGNLGGVAAGNDAIKNGIQQGTLSNSRIGFKGTEDLGNGLKANFVYEVQVNPDEKANQMETRVGTVGLSGNFGAVTLGRQYTPYFVVQGAMDFAGNMNSMPGYVVNNHISDGGRANSLNYSSPSFGGFSAIAQIGSGPVGAGTESTVTNGGQADGKNYGLAGIYAAGPLVAGLAYEEVTHSGSALSAYGSITTPTANTTLGQANKSAAIVTFGNNSDAVKTWAAGASYDFTVVKASLAYSSLTDTAATRPDLTSKGWNISLSAPIGAVTVYGNLGRANYKQDAGVATASDASIKGFQLGANYALSKRTTAYAVVGRDTLTVDSLSGTGLTGDFTRTATTVGVRHTF